MSTRLALFQLGGMAAGSAVALAALFAFEISSGIAGIVVGCVCIFVGNLTALRLGVHLDDLKHKREMRAKYFLLLRDEIGFTWDERAARAARARREQVEP